MDGVVNVHKIAGPTSHDVVNQIRRIFGQKKVGHAGTLDPMATGVLVVCLGKATRVVEYLTTTQKEYRAVLTLGITTNTQDSSGDIITECDASGVTMDALKSAVQSFVGEIEQIPPMISAIKYEGKPLYKHAREGKIIERAPRKVTISSIDIIPLSESKSPNRIPGDITSEAPIPLGILPGSAHPEVEIIVKCSSGTYIRTLCADIGEMLGCGGMMSKLERTRVGNFAIDDAVTVDKLIEIKSEDRLCNYVSKISDALVDMPKVSIDEDYGGRILNGISVPIMEQYEPGITVGVMSAKRELLAIGIIEDKDGVLIVKPHKVFVDVMDQ